MRLLAWLVLPFAMLIRAYRRYRSSPIVMFYDGTLRRVEWAGKTYVFTLTPEWSGGTGKTWYCEQDGRAVTRTNHIARLNGAIHAHSIAQKIDAAIIGPPKLDAPKEAAKASQDAGFKALAEWAGGPTPKTLPNEAFKDSHGNDCLRWAGRIYVKVSGQWLYGESLKSVDDSGLWLDINRKWEQLKAEQKLQEQIRKQGLRPMS